MKKHSIRLLIIALILSLFMQTVAFAAETSTGYVVQLASSGLTNTASDYTVDDTSHTLTGTEAKVTVNKTCIIKIKSEPFLFQNTTGNGIGKSKTRTASNAKGLTIGANSSKTSTELAVFKTTRDVLTKLGYTLDKTSTAYYFAFFTSLEYAVLVEITPNGLEPPKPLSFDELNKQLDRVSDEKASDWYTTGDRWNGAEYSKNGFWADLTKAGGSLATAKKALNAVTQDEIDTACADLKTAIDKLIPKTRANTTLLYEAMQHTVDKDRYTPMSYAAFTKAYDEASALMASMFDSDGNPTEANKPDKQQTLEALAEKLEAAWKDLDERVS